LAGYSRYYFTAKPKSSTSCFVIHPSLTATIHKSLLSGIWLKREKKLPPHPKQKSDSIGSGVHIIAAGGHWY